MAAIVDILNGSSAVAGEQQMQLAGQFWTRKLAIGANWTNIRILVRGSFLIATNSSITSTNFNPGLMIGLTTNLKHYNDPAADCVGVYWDQTFSVSSNQVTYVWSSATPYNFHKVGSTFSSTAVGNNGARAHPVWPNLRCIGCDILRTATSFTITQISNIGGSSQTSVSQAQFYAALETPGGVASSVTLESAATVAAAYTGTGPLNSVMVWCRSTMPCFVISDIAVCRFA